MLRESNQKDMSIVDSKTSSIADTKASSIANTKTDKDDASNVERTYEEQRGR